MNNIDFPKAEIVQLSNMVSYQTGSIVSRIIIKKPNGNLSLFAFDKNQSLSEHSAPFDAMIQILDGKAEVIIGGVSYHLICGETIIMPANIPHAVTPRSSSRCY